MRASPIRHLGDAPLRRYPSAGHPSATFSRISSIHETHTTDVALCRKLRSLTPNKLIPGTIFCLKLVYVIYIYIYIYIYVYVHKGKESSYIYMYIKIYIWVFTCLFSRQDHIIDLKFSYFCKSNQIAISCKIELQYLRTLHLQTKCIDQNIKKK